VTCNLYDSIAAVWAGVCSKIGCYAEQCCCKTAPMSAAHETCDAAHAPQHCSYTSLETHAHVTMNATQCKRRAVELRLHT